MILLINGGSIVYQYDDYNVKCIINNSLAELHPNFKTLFRNLHNDIYNLH